MLRQPELRTFLIACGLPVEVTQSPKGLAGLPSVRCRCAVLHWCLLLHSLMTSMLHLLFEVTSTGQRIFTPSVLVFTQLSPLHAGQAQVQPRAAGRAARARQAAPERALH